MIWPGVIVIVTTAGHAASSSRVTQSHDATTLLVGSPVSWDMGPPVRDPGLLSSDRGSPVSPRTRQISNVWGEEREGCDEAGEKKDEASDCPGSEIRLYLCQSHINAPLIGHSLQQKKTFLRFHLSWQISLSVPESLLAHAREDPSPGNT